VAHDELSNASPGPDPRHWLIIGAGGQVGGALVAAGPRGRVTGTERHRSSSPSLDLQRVATDPVGVDAFLRAMGPTIVVIAAGMTDVERCEDDPDAAWRVNCESPGLLARVAHGLGARTVYYSTEYVFDGRSGPYDEASSPAPLSVYGTSKLAGELAVLEGDPDALIIRTTVVYGPERQGKNFAYRVAGVLRTGSRLAVPCDQISTPTYNRDLAAATIELVDAGVTGIVHVTGPARVDRAVFARELAGAAGLDGSRIDGRPTADLGQRAPRPLDAGLVSTRGASAAVLPPMRTTRDAVDHWLRHPSGRPWPAVQGGDLRERRP